MKPEAVNPGNFVVEKILYNKNGFSIAIGVWTGDNSKRFAMRWNERDGKPPTDKGYPSVFNNPMWFQLPVDAAEVIDILKSNNG